MTFCNGPKGWSTIFGGRMFSVRSKLAGFSAIAMIAAALPAQAQIVFNTSVPGQITVSWDETLTTTANSATAGAGGYLFLVASNVFSTADGDAYLRNLNSMTQTVSIDGGPAQTVANWSGWQFRGGPEGSYGEMDLLLGLSSNSMPSFNAGDTFTWAGSLTADITATDRMTDLPGNSTVSAYLANYQGNWSNTIQTTVDPVSVPEPASLATLGAGMIALGFIGRRRA